MPLFDQPPTITQHPFPQSERIAIVDEAQNLTHGHEMPGVLEMVHFLISPAAGIPTIVALYCHAPQPSA